MHLHCDASGETTVLLIAAFTDGGDHWGAVPASLTDRARVCSYARFGAGTSDAPPSDQTFATEAEDLRAMLDTAGEPGPYVVIGHSYGGPEAVTFASHYADDVDGVLIDASPTTWYETLCSVPDDGSDTAQMFVDNCAAQTDPGRNPERGHDDAAATARRWTARTPAAAGARCARRCWRLRIDASSWMVNERMSYADRNQETVTATRMPAS
jgi:pimeloyl-ACP methyl ester carboxylesterase